MYHNKEIMNLVPKVQDIKTDDDSQDFTIEGWLYPGKPPEVKRTNVETSPILSKIRFGELGVGDKFVFDGSWLIKTGEYSAESDRKRGKKNYLFFKKDIVQSIKFISLSDNLIKEKYDLFDGHFDTLQYLQDSEKPQCEIVITPGQDRHHVEVLGNDGYRWETTFKGNLNESWCLPLRLKHYEFVLMYDCKEIQIYAEEQKIWCKDFFSWDGVHTCSILIKDIRLEPGDE